MNKSINRNLIVLAGSVFKPLGFTGLSLADDVDLEKIVVTPSVSNRKVFDAPARWM